MAFQHGQIWATALKANWCWRQLNEWETLLALRPRCPALQNEREGNFFLLLQVCLLPGGTCFSVEKGPVTLEDVLSIWLKLEDASAFAPAANREFDVHQGLSAVWADKSILPVSLTPRCYWIFRLDIRKKTYYAVRTVKRWSRLSPTVLFLLRCAPWSAPARRIKYGRRCQPCAVPALSDPFTAPMPELNIRVWYLQNWAAGLYGEQRGIQLRCRVSTEPRVPSNVCKKCNSAVKRNDDMEGSLLFSLRNECIHPNIKGRQFNCLLFLKQ